MKNKELAAALSLLRGVLAEPRLDSARREKLRKGYKELEKIGRSGKLDQRKVFRAVWLISSTLAEELPGTEPSDQAENSTTAR